MAATRVLTGHHLAGWQQTRGVGITARFIDKRSGARLPDAAGDLLIGADGIHSGVRQTLYPDEGAADLERRDPVARHHPRPHRS